MYGSSGLDFATYSDEFKLKNNKPIFENENIVLEKKTANLSEKKKSYINKVMAGKSAQFITENIDYALSLFNKTEGERLQQLRTEAATTSTEQVDRPVIEEQVVATHNEMEQNMSPYLKELNKF